MKKILKLTCFALLSLIAVGCGKKGIVPEKTVVAAYVDLEKAYENGKSVVKAVINALPSDCDRAKTVKEYEQGLKWLDKYYDSLNPKWAVIALGGNLARFANSRRLADHVAFAFRVDADEATVDKLAKGELGRERKDEEGPQLDKDKRKEGIVYTLSHGQGFIGLIDDKYLVFSLSKDAFYDMFDLYAGKSKPSKDFGNLTRISGNTICRISTAPISSLLDRFELAREIERFGEDCDDEDLADMILSIGAATLDIGADKEDFGLSLRVVCGSASDAKILDHFFQAIAFSSRVAFDIGAYAAKNPDKFKDMQGDRRSPYREIGRLSRKISTATGSFIALSRALEAERDGNTATISCLIGTEDLAKLISEQISNARKAYAEDRKVEKENANRQQGEKR